MNKQPRLSKSSYVSGMQCPKILWMKRNMPEKFDDSVMNQVILDRGNEIGDLAMKYFGTFTEVNYTQDISKMVAETEKLITEGTKVITEAAFTYNNDLCIVDILHAVPGGFELIEVKGSSGSPGDTADDVKEVYLHDMSFQAYILTNCGLDIKSIKLMCLNREYVRQGDLDEDLNIKELFVLIDCTDTVFEMMKNVEKNTENFKTFMTQEDEPVADIGGRCEKPYSCGYMGWCFRELPENDSIFDIGWNMRMVKKEKAYKDGIHSFQDALAAFNDGKLDLKDKQLQQVKFAVNDIEPSVCKSGINDFLSKVRYPLYFLDFETFQPAIPPWKNSSPFKQITFQYSLHIQKERDGEVVHKEFLGRDGHDPRRELAEGLCTNIPEDACVIAYNMTFEKTRIKEMAGMFPDLSSHLLSINANMIDLMEPFKAGAYYSRLMGDGYSIKQVLPALIQDDPELDYKSLDERVQHGGHAMDKYPTMHMLPPDEKEALRKALLAYCRLDTLAMVKILEKLYELAN